MRSGARGYPWWPGAMQLQARAGYRSARPILSRSSNPACNARPVHTKVPQPGLSSPFGFARTWCRYLPRDASEGAPKSRWFTGADGGRRILLGQWLGGECRAAVRVLARSRHCVAISAILTWEDKMRRRDIVFGFSGAALAMLDNVGAQQVARVWRVGTVGIEPRDRGQYLFDVFSQKLAEFGYQQGRNIDLTVHFAEARIEKIEELLVPLVVNLDLLVIWSTIGLIAAKKVVPPALPTVFLGVGDPVRVGAVQSLSRPGGNMTGVTYELSTETWAKRVELLKEIVPNLDRVGVLKARNDPNSAYAMASLEPWLPALGVTLVAVDFTSTEELDAAFSEMMRKNVKGLLVISGALTFVMKVLRAPPSLSLLCWQPSLPATSHRQMPARSAIGTKRTVNPGLLRLPGTCKKLQYSSEHRP